MTRRLSTRVTFAAILVAAGLLVSSARADVEKRTTRVTPAGPAVVEVTAGSSSTIVFRASNDADSVRAYTTRLQLPEGWHATNTAPFEIEPLDTVSRLVSLRIPLDTPPGIYRVGYQLAATETGNVEAETFVDTKVLPRFSLVVEPLNAPLLVRPGDAFHVTFHVANGSNVGISAAPTATGSSAFTVFADSAVISLGPGESSTYTVSVTALEVPSTTRHSVLLSLDVAESTHRATAASASIEVVSTTRFVTVPGRSLPVSVGLRSAGGKRGHGLQLEMRGTHRFNSGTLDFDLTGPDLRFESIYGERDSYTLHFKNDLFSIRLGDERYELSPLTERGRRGFGVRFDAHVDERTDVGGFLQKSRYRVPRERQQAAYVRYAVTPSSSIAVNVLDQSGFVEGTSFTILGEAVPFDDNRVSVELGSGRGNGNRGAGYSVQWSGSEQVVSYRLGVTHSGPWFPGYYRAQNVTSASVSVRPLPSVRFDGSFSSRQRDATTATSVLRSSDSDRFIRAGGALSGGRRRPGTLATVHFQHRLHEFGRDSLVLDRRENMLALSGRLGLGDAAISARFDVGRRQSRQLEKTGLFQDAALQGSWRRGRFNVDATTRLLNGISLSRADNLRTLHLIGGAEANITDDSGLRVRAAYSKDFRSSFADFSFYEGVAWRQFRGVRIEAEVRYSSFRGFAFERSVEYGLNLQMPVDLPLARSSQRPSLVGIVFDGESGEPVEGVIVDLDGEKRVSGPDGTFAIPTRGAGPYHFSMDRLSADLRRVPQIALPMSIGPEEISDLLEIPLVRSGKIRGAVLLKDHEAGVYLDDARLVVLGGARRVLVEFTSASERYRTLTDDDGMFSLVDLRPGEWTVRVIDAKVGANRQLVTDVAQLRLAPGDDRQITFEAIPVRRRITMLPAEKQSVDTRPDDRLPSPQIRVDTEPASTSSACVPAEMGGSGLTHTVQPKESLAALARGYYCKTVLWPRIWLANRDKVANPNLIYPGDALAIPYVKSVALPKPGQTKPDAGALVHTVKRGETLVSIARDHLGDELLWPRIWLVNRGTMARPESLDAGATILLPDPTRLHPEERRALGAE